MMQPVLYWGNDFFGGDRSVVDLAGRERFEEFDFPEAIQKEGASPLISDFLIQLR